MKLYYYQPNFVTTIMVMLVVLAVQVREGEADTCGSPYYSALVQLLPCQAAVAPIGPLPPTESCCASLQALGQPCLCVLLSGPPISGVDVDLVLQLPKKCTANFEPCDLQTEG